jgi:hypothetical protein
MTWINVIVQTRQYHVYSKQDSKGMKRTAVFSSMLCMGILFSCHSTRADPDENCGRLKAGDNFNRINEILDCIESKIRTSSSLLPTAPNSESSGPPSSYRIITTYFSTSNVEFQVFVNDLPVGAYSANGANADITRFIKPGQNKVRITWTADPGMASIALAKLTLENQIDEKWSPLISREVTKTTKAGESTSNLFAAPRQ